MDLSRFSLSLKANICFRYATPQIPNCAKDGPRMARRLSCQSQSTDTLISNNRSAS
jgi:hypothetical protein